MSWETLEPAGKVTGAPMVSCSIRMKKDGSATLALFLSTFIVEAMGSPEAVAVAVGRDEHAGQLRLAFGEGPFKVGGAMRFCRVTLPAPDYAPARDVGSLPCRIVSQDAATKLLVVELPVKDWGRLGPAAAAPASSPPPAAQTVAPPKVNATISPSNPLDAEAYLRTKGHKVSRMAGGRLAVDGDELLPGAVLALINQHRAKMDLEPLPRASVV